MSEATSETPVITFYSFKGGVGRSMAVINTAGILAGLRGFRVLVIDIDLEAPGLSYIDPELPDHEKNDISRRPNLQAGFIDLLSNALDQGQEGDLFVQTPEEIIRRYTQRMRIPDVLRDFEDGVLDIMPAGRFDGEYAARLDALQLGVLYRQGIGAPLIAAFKKRLVDSRLYDYILVDSRTGFSDEAGICTRDLGDQLVILSGLNRQNVEGTCEFLKTLRVATEGKKIFQIVLSPVPNGEDKLFEEREGEAKKAFTAAWGNNVDLSLQIPYHPQLALTEEPHIFRRLRGPLFEAYKAVELRMLRSLKHTASFFAGEITSLLSDKKYVSALGKLKHLVRFENGKDALFRIVESIEYSSYARFTKGDRNKSDDQATPKQMLDDEDGKRILEFIVRYVPLSTRSYPFTNFVRNLVQHSQELLVVLIQRLSDPSFSDDDTVLSFANLFAELRKWNFAEQLYKQMVDRAPDNKTALLAYASFLERRRRYAEANTYYSRAIDSNSKLDSQENYAIFLFHYMGDYEAAGKLYQTVVAKRPEGANTLANYGQFLAATGELARAEETLLHAYSRLSERFDSDERSNMAELILAIWMVKRMQGREALVWERRFKWLVTKGFTRNRWSFTGMLKEAEKYLSPHELTYADALANAFLFKRNVQHLNSFDKWNNLEALPSLHSEPSTPST